MIYEIDFKGIEDDYINSKNNTIAHKPEKKYNILPYTTTFKESVKPEIIEGFDKAVGEFSREITNTKMIKNFDTEKYKESVIKNISMDEKNKTIMKNLISKLFFKKDKLSSFHPITLNYIDDSSNYNKKLGRFLIDVLFESSEEVKKYIDLLYSNEVDNILLRLMISQLPQLDKETSLKRVKYKRVLPYIQELFMEDFLYLIKNNGNFSENIEKLLKFYYLIYVSQLSIALKDMFNADVTKCKEIYFALDWENISKGRSCIDQGWGAIESNMKIMFSHANTLDLINHNKEDRQYSYIELKDRLDSMNDQEKNEFIAEITKLIEFYRSYIHDVNWNEFKKNTKFLKEEEEIVNELFLSINYQFNKSGRKGKDRNYGSWFIEFCKHNFLKTRGRYGSILNLTEEYIIFLTKICIKNNEKLKTKILFKEFRRRGVFLDNDSEIKLIQLYEKLNILEKKSDSGDAQYVKRIL